MAAPAALFEYLVRLGDNCLILGHRLSEWCGHGPVLEEDLALTNVALDLIGQATLWLELAGEIEGRGRTADQLAYLRDAGEFRNLLLVEQPNGHYGETLARQFYFDTWHCGLLQGLSHSQHPRVADIAASFQDAVAEVLVAKCRQALKQRGRTSLCIGGGVAANRRFREELEQLTASGIEVHTAPMNLCTDNAAMGAIAWELYRAGTFSELDIDVVPGLVRA